MSANDTDLSDREGKLWGVVKGIVSQKNAPLTPEAICQEALRQQPSLLEGKTVMECIKEVRALLEKHGLSANGGGVKEGEDGFRGHTPAPMSLEEKIIASHVPDSRRQAIVAELLSWSHTAPTQSVGLSQGPFTTEGQTDLRRPFAVPDLLAAKERGEVDGNGKGEGDLDALLKRAAAVASDPRVRGKADKLNHCLRECTLAYESGQQVPPEMIEELRALVDSLDPDRGQVQSMAPTAGNVA